MVRNIISDNIPVRYERIYSGLYRKRERKNNSRFGIGIKGIRGREKVYIVQFIKGMPYSEIKSINTFSPGISIKQLGLGCFIIDQPTENDINAARNGLSEATRAIHCCDYDLVILDEACIAVHYNLFKVRELIGCLTSKPAAVEIVVTGRYAPRELLEIADLVTEMKEREHYYHKGFRQEQE